MEHIVTFGLVEWISLLASKLEFYTIYIRPTFYVSNKKIDKFTSSKTLVLMESRKDHHMHSVN